MIAVVVFTHVEEDVGGELALLAHLNNYADFIECVIALWDRDAFAAIGEPVDREISQQYLANAHRAQYHIIGLVGVERKARAEGLRTELAVVECIGTVIIDCGEHRPYKAPWPRKLAVADVEDVVVDTCAVHITNCGCKIFFDALVEVLAQYTLRARQVDAKTP